MAIFTSTNELPKQKRFRQFKQAKGLRAGIMNIAGYNASGTKNTWGKINPLGYAAPALTGSVAEMAASGSDAGQVIKENRGNMMAQQFAAGKLAMNFVPGGAAMKIGAGMGLDAAQDAAAGGDGIGADDITGAGSSLVSGMNEKAATDSAMESIDAGVESSTALDDVSNVSDELNYSTEADYLSATGGAAEGIGDVAEGSGKFFGKGGGLAKGVNKFQTGKFAKGLDTATNVASIAGDVANVAQTAMAHNKGLKKSKDDLMRQTLSNAYQNYL